MKSEFKYHIKSIIEKLEIEDNSRDNEKVCFLKHYSGISIEEEDMINIMASLNIDYDMLYYKFNASLMQGVFCPFFPFIREMYIKYYSNISAEEFSDRTGVYKAVEYLFSHYIDTGVFERSEDIIPRELEYEQERIIESIISIIRYISDEHKVVIVLDNIQEAQQSTILLLLSIMKSNNLNNVVIIGTYNEAYSVSTYMKNSWNELEEYIKKSGLSVDCAEEESDIISNDTFIPDADDMDVYLRNIKDMYLCLTLNQAKYYLGIIYNAVESDNIEVSFEERFDVLYLFSIVTVLNREDKLAYLYCKKMYNYNIEQLQKDKERLFKYYYAYALVNKQSGQIDAASEAIAKGKAIAEEIGDKEKEIKIDMLRMIVLLDKYPDILLWKPEEDMPVELVNEAEENNYRLHLAYAYVYGFKVYNEDNIIRDDLCYEEMPEFMKGIKIAEELGNVQLQIRAWQRIALQISSDKKEFCYGKCLDIMKEYNHKNKEAQIYNGIGYSYLIHENYDLAVEYFKRALIIGIDVRETSYILDSVYNMAVVGITTANYDDTIRCVMTILKMMPALRLERLNVCNKTKLYGLVIFSYIKKNQIYNAKRYFDMMETALDHILSSNNPDYSMWEDDIYLYYLVKGMIYMQEGNYKEAQENFRIRHELWNKFESKQDYIVVRAVEEEVSLYDITGDYAKWQDCLQRAIKLCKENKLNKGADRLKKILDKENIPESEKVQMVDDAVLEKAVIIADRCGMKLELKQKDKLIHFFETWVDLLDDDFESVDEMISSAMLNIRNIFDIDGILYIKAGKKAPAVVYSDGEVELKKYQLKYICGFFEEYRRRIIASRFQKSYKYYEDLIAAFNRNDIVSLVAIPFFRKDKLSEVFVTFKFQQINYTENLDMLYEEEAEVLRTAFHELIEAVNRERIKRQLEKNSVTDLLTKLYNRQGFVKCIDGEFQRAKEEQRDKNIMFTILYMDLDNFKYCNDNFGHDAGDAVLVAFSDMLGLIVEKSGYIVRYGGDEFLVILPDENTDKGIEIAEKIFANIKHNKGFKKVLESVKDEEINIEEKHRVTCSVGIASGRASDREELTEILKHADEALYDVKKGTKHNYKVYGQ